MSAGPRRGGRGPGRRTGRRAGVGPSPQSSPQRARTPSAITDAERAIAPVLEVDLGAPDRPPAFDPAGGPGNDELPDYGDWEPHDDDDGDSLWVDETTGDEFDADRGLRRERPEIVINLVGGSRLRAVVDERVVAARSEAWGTPTRAKRLERLGELLVEDQAEALRATSLRAAFLRLKPRMQKELALGLDDEDTDGKGNELGRESRTLVSTPFGVVHLGFFRWGAGQEQTDRLLTIARHLSEACRRPPRTLASSLAGGPGWSVRTIRQNLTELRMLAIHPREVQIARRLFPLRSWGDLWTVVAEQGRSEKAIHLAIVGALEFPLDNTPDSWRVIVREDPS